MRFEELYDQRTQGRLSVEEGAAGLADQRLAKMAHNAAPIDEVLELLSLFETRYPRFTVAHFYDKYRDEHKGTRGYTWVKTQLQKAGLVNKASKRGMHRRKREREPMTGMLLHQDGSTHLWTQGVKEVVRKQGLFCSLYTDRGSHYWNTPQCGGKVDKINLTQFGSAMRHAGIEMVPAYSPEARGRSERMFGTLQVVYLKN
jgi:hypothetical protein